MVSSSWIAEIRRRNQERFGMSGLGYVSSQDLVGAIRQEREYRTDSVHRGRFTREDPDKPAPGSVESIAQAMGPINAPQIPTRVPTSLVVIGIGAVVGIVGLAVYAGTRGKA